ncbi:hypothetical protein Taro_040926 [Colocasia esculenta]|uniref:Uncharacterized protein n=1 Tax=Colocasia esculenta TaxID=4460 RepID=A0A843WRV4_COLES|nr:hypothetical protein [Colocasia esculenta]
MCFLITPDHVFCSGRATSVDTLSQNSPESVLGSSLVSTLPDLVSTHSPILTQKVVMRNQWSQMGQGKSDEHLSYE